MIKLKSLLVVVLVLHKLLQLSKILTKALAVINTQLYASCQYKFLFLGLVVIGVLNIKANYKIFSLNKNSYKAIVIPQILFGLLLALIVPTFLEFTIAQSPLEMRGLMIGLWFAAYGLGYAINISGKYSFKCKSDVICQNLYYYVFKSVVFLIIMIMFLVLAKRYKLRVRENKVNIHLIAEEHYERYIEQKVEYERK